MKKSIVLTMLLAAAVTAGAQLKNKLGNITRADIEFKECSFDENASAVVLVDEGFSDYTESYDLITHRYRKVKILRESGIANADLQLDFQSGSSLEDVVSIEVLVTNVDDNGQWTKHTVGRTGIFRSRINEDWSRISVAVPQVQVGSIIEYSYKVLGKHYGMLRDWNFQDDIPVVNSRYNLNIVPNVEMSYLVQFSPGFHVDVKPNNSSNSVSFEMSNIPALTDEPYMDASDDYIQKVIFQITKIATSGGNRNLMSTWPEVSRELIGRSDFGRQLKVNIDECALVVSAVKNKPEFERMQTIYQHVQKNTRWNGRRSLISKEGVKHLWKTGSGFSGDINLSLVNLLNKAGLKAYPLLVSERWNGRINKSMPFIDQFNNVFAVVLIGEKKYYLDATDKFTPAHITPTSILNTSAYIISVKEGMLVDIMETEKRMRDIIVVQGNLAGDGTYGGTVQVISRDYARCSRMRKYAEDKGDKYIAENILNGLGNVTIDSLRFENVDNDTLDLKEKFQYKTVIQRTGEYAFLSLNMFSGYEQNPFILKNRFSNVNFGCSRSTYLTWVIQLPDHHTVDALPSNLKLKNADGSVVFVRELLYDKNRRQISARIKIEINKSLFTVDEYPALHEFYRKMIDLMNEQVVLKQS